MAQAGVDSLDLTLTIEQGGQGTKEVSEIVQANLAEIGINVNIEGLRLVGVLRSLERRGPAQPSAVLHQLRLGA